MTRKAYALVLLGLKLLITAVLITYLMRKIGIAPVLHQIRTIDPMSAALAMMIVLTQLALMSMRWQLVNQLVGARMRLRQVVRLTFVGQFFSQVLPSATGGDAVRAWLASREGVPIGRAVTGILCDRAAALAALMLIISCTLYFLPAVVPERLPSTSLLRTLDLIGLSALAALLIFGARISRLLMRYRVTASIGNLMHDLRKVLFSQASSAVIMALSITIQVLQVMAIYMCARGMRIHLDFSTALLLIPTIMLVAMIPISFAGWGVREGAMILGLGLVGIAQPDALAVSVTFGLLHVMAGLPGGALWLMRNSSTGLRAQIE